MTTSTELQIGFVSASTVTLPWDGAAFLPAGARVVVTGMNVLGHNEEEFARAGGEMPRAVEALAKDGAGGVLVNAAPLSASWGWAREQAVAADLRSRLGIVLETSTSAIATSAHELGFKRLVLVSAYSEAVNSGLDVYLNDAGLRCLAAAGMSADGPSASRRLGPDSLAALAEATLAALADRPDAIVLGSRGSVEASVSAVREATGVPVLHGTTAGVWAIMRQLGAPCVAAPWGAEPDGIDREEGGV